MATGQGLCSQDEPLNWFKATHTPQSLAFQLLLLLLSMFLPSLCCQYHHLFADCVYSQYIHFAPSHHISVSLLECCFPGLMYH